MDNGTLPRFTKRKSDYTSIDGVCNCGINLPICQGCFEDIETYEIGAITIHWQNTHWHLRCAFDTLYESVE